jgi:hypothetical protein
MSFRPEYRWNVWDWRDLVAVVRLQIPPYRWQRCVPLGRFGLGFGRPYGMLVWRFGWWGFRFRDYDFVAHDQSFTEKQAQHAQELGQRYGWPRSKRARE